MERKTVAEAYRTKLPLNRRQATREQDTQIRFCFYDLDLDQMTLTYDLYLMIPKVYLQYQRRTCWVKVFES